MTDYAAKFQQMSQSQVMLGQAQRSKQLLSQYGTWINRYRGGLPAGWASTIMMFESDGQANLPGDPSLGEWGLYQVATYVPEMLGLPASSIRDPETNVMVGLTEYQVEQGVWANYLKGYVEPGTADAMKLARLTFAIGRGGAQGLASYAASAGLLARGAVYDSIVKYINTRGGVALGSQSAELVWYRVKVMELQWKVGRLVDSTSPGPLITPPNPPGYTYKLPANVAGYFRKPFSPAILVAGVAAAGLAAYVHTRR